MAKMKEQIEAIFTKEMDRKNFLKYSGGIVLGLLGVTGLVRLLSGASSQTTEHTESNGGYGSSPYGK